MADAEIEPEESCTVPRRARRRSRRTEPAATAPAPVSMPPIATWAFFPTLLLWTLAVLSIHPVKDPDCWFHMALGRIIGEEGTFPRGDLFSLTSQGNEWISSGWLSSVLLHVAYSFGGGAALALVVLAVMAITYLAVYAWSERDGGNGLCAIMLVAAAIAASVRFTPRPEIFSHMFSVLLIITLTSGESGRGRRLWFVPVIIAVWSNFHAGYMAGMLLIAMYAGWRGLLWRRTHEGKHLMALAPCAVAFIAWIANPYGIRLPALAGKIRDMPNVESRILEWAPLLSDAPLLPTPVYFGVAAVLLLALWTLVQCQFRLPLWRLGGLVLFAVLEFHQRRHIGLSSISIVALLAPELGRAARAVPNSRVVLTVCAAACALLVTVLQARGAFDLGRGLFSTHRDEELLPAQLVDFLEKNPPPQPLFNSYGPGGYLLYHLGPETKVFIDGRLDIYDRETWIDYNAIEDGTVPMEEMAAKYGFNSAVVYIRAFSSHPAHLVRRLTTSPDWQICYFDDNYAFFVRRTRETASYRDRLGYKWLSPVDFGPMIAAMNGSSESVLAEIQEAITRSQGSARAHLGAAIAYRQLGDTSRAAMHEQKAAQKDPTMRLTRR